MLWTREEQIARVGSVHYRSFPLNTMGDIGVEERLGDPSVSYDNNNEERVHGFADLEEAIQDARDRWTNHCRERIALIEKKLSSWTVRMFQFRSRMGLVKNPEKVLARIATLKEELKRCHHILEWAPEIEVSYITDKNLPIWIPNGTPVFRVSITTFDKCPRIKVDRWVVAGLDIYPSHDDSPFQGRVFYGVSVDGSSFQRTFEVPYDSFQDVEIKTTHYNEVLFFDEVKARDTARSWYQAMLVENREWS